MMTSVALVFALLVAGEEPPQRKSAWPEWSALVGDWTVVQESPAGVAPPRAPTSYATFSFVYDLKDHVLVRRRTSGSAVDGKPSDPGRDLRYKSDLLIIYREGRLTHAVSFDSDGRSDRYSAGAYPDRWELTTTPGPVAQIRTTYRLVDKLLSVTREYLDPNTGAYKVVEQVKAARAQAP